MKPRVMPPAQPSHSQRLVILIVMSIYRRCTADFAFLLLQVASLHCTLYGKMSLVFARVRSAPVCLSVVSFQHRSRSSCASNLTYKDANDPQLVIVPIKIARAT